MGLLTPLAVKIGSWSFMPKLLPQITATDKFSRSIRGRVTLLDIAGLPNLTLTVGRKSGSRGRRRCSPYLGADWLIAGSNFGGPKQPVWVVNLEANPDARSRSRAGRTTCRPGASRAPSGRPGTHGETWPNYRMYESDRPPDQGLRLTPASP